MTAVHIPDGIYEELKAHCLARSIPIRHFVSEVIKAAISGRPGRIPIRKMVCVRIPEKETDAYRRPPFWAGRPSGSGRPK